MHLTDEMMEEIAQWQHDESLAAPIDDTIPTESDSENFEIDMLTDCLNGNHTMRFEIVSGHFTAICEDGCS